MPRKEGSNDILPVGETPTGVIDCIVLIDEGCGRGKIMVGENAGQLQRLGVAGGQAEGDQQGAHRVHQVKVATPLAGSS